MADELKKLEAKRNALYKKIMSLGDFRRGTISVKRSAKPNRNTEENYY